MSTVLHVILIYYEDLAFHDPVLRNDYDDGCPSRSPSTTPMTSSFLSRDLGTKVRPETVKLHTGVLSVTGWEGSHRDGPVTPVLIMDGNGGLKPKDPLEPPSISSPESHGPNRHYP